MKTLLCILLFMTSINVFGDYKSETPAIEKFEVEEFLNKKNYPPSKPGEIPKINKAFADKLNSEPTSLKYFVLLMVAYRLVDLYKKDKAFALALESKFGGTKMNKEKWERVFEHIGNPILKESNAEHKKAIANPENSNAYFKKHLSIVNESSFK